MGAIWSRFQKNHFNLREYLNIEDRVNTNILPEEINVECENSPRSILESKTIKISAEQWEEIDLNPRFSKAGTSKRTYPGVNWTDCVFDILQTHFIFPCNLSFEFKSKTNLCFAHCSECLSTVDIVIVYGKETEGVDWKVECVWNHSGVAHYEKRSIRGKKKREWEEHFESGGGVLEKLEADRVAMSKKGHLCKFF